jgi:DNA-binding IclR family transcriptional regulator
MWWPYRPEDLATDLWAELLEAAGLTVRVMHIRSRGHARIQATAGRLTRLDVTVGGRGRLWCTASAEAALNAVRQAGPEQLWVEVGECDGQYLGSVIDVQANVRRLAAAGDVTAGP